MNVSTTTTALRGSRLLAAHLDRFDLTAPTARERLEEQLGTELARKLVFALAARGAARRAA